MDDVLLIYILMGSTLSLLFLSHRNKSKGLRRCAFCLWLAWGASLIYAAVRLVH
jgi:hypothetical protein